MIDSAEQMISLGWRFSAVLSAGDLVLLYGDLGSGKTTFSKGIVAGKGGDEDIVVSPSFSILNIYDTDPKIYHIDLYRLSEDSDTGFLEDYLLDIMAITLVEWPKGRIKSFPHTYLVEIFSLGNRKRKVHISPGSSIG